MRNHATSRRERSQNNREATPSFLPHFASISAFFHFSAVASRDDDICRVPRGLPYKTSAVGGGGSQKTIQKEQNQLICDNDRGVIRFSGRFAKVELL